MRCLIITVDILDMLDTDHQPKPVAYRCTVWLCRTCHTCVEYILWQLVVHNDDGGGGCGDHCGDGGDHCGDGGLSNHFILINY